MKNKNGRTIAFIKISNVCIWFFIFVVLGIEPRTSHMLVTHFLCQATSLVLFLFKAEPKLVA